MAFKLFAGAGKPTRAGFSLLELCIVIAMLGLLALLALPSYQRYQLAAKRQQAEQILSLLVYQGNNFSLQTDEVFSAQHVDTWLENMNLATDLGYNFSFIRDESGFWFFARPQARQSQDRCGELYLSQANLKGAALSDGSCWNGHHNYRPTN